MDDDDGATKDGSSEQDVSIIEPNRPFNLRDYYDYDSFPESQANDVLSWTHFTRDFHSLDKVVTPEIKDICQKQPDKLLDLRPYMIENPETCTKFDFLPKILNRFTNMHLRHLTVVNPVTGHIEGMITRQDIFKWMPL